MDASNYFALPCKAANLRGQLKHKYLTNTVALKAGPEQLHQSMLYEEEGVARHLIICRRLEELAEAMSALVGSFSPAQLLDKLGPFMTEPPEILASLKDAVHRQFAREFDLANRTTRLHQKSNRFVGLLHRFLDGGMVNLVSAEIKTREVQEAARDLIRELGTLPEGIWLWSELAREERVDRTT